MLKSIHLESNIIDPVRNDESMEPICERDKRMHEDLKM